MRHQLMIILAARIHALGTVVSQTVRRSGKKNPLLVHLSTRQLKTQQSMFWTQVHHIMPH